ncbi:MAG: DUF5691 domain-containing protein [Nannocystaceae bacterium]
MDPLVKRALVGTGQAGALGSGGGLPELRALLDPLRELDAEERLLLEAGAAAVYRCAGATSDGPAPPLDRSPADGLRPCSSAMTEILREMLVGEQRDLLPLALVELRGASMSLPAELLPLALACPEDQRVMLHPVLGARGRWLATKNPAWSWALRTSLSDDDPPPENAAVIFEEGDLAARKRVFRQMRRHDPATARGWLEETWQQEKADVRRALLGLLRQGLSAADEPFLAAALEDRAVSVRGRAADLLGRLLDSALCARMTAGALPLLALKPASVAAKLKAAIDGREALGTVSVHLPEAFDPAWAKDAVIETSPGGVGRKAWWVTQLVAATPLRAWTERLGAAPAALVASLRGNDLAAPVLDGWTTAALRQGDRAWMGPLWDLWRRLGGQGVLTPRPQVTLLAAMEPADAEARVSDLLGDGTLICDLLAALPRPWPERIGAAYLDGLERWIARLDHRRPQSNDPWLDSLRIAGPALPSAHLARARALPPPLEQGSNWYSDKWKAAFRIFTEALDLRQRLAQEMRS